MNYDFTDQSITWMIQEEHRPTEIQLVKTRYLGNIPVMEEYEFGSEPRCKTCRQPWPCPSIKALRAYEAERQKAHYAQMAEGGYQNTPGPW